MNIVEPNESFDFSKLSLAEPICIPGSAYFTKISYNGKPLYIQTTKSQTKQGFVKSGKKYHCDIMFHKNDETMVNWFENLEEKCQKLIFEKRDAWFQNSLEESDIETAFNSPIRTYKSGKFYVIRTNIRNTNTNTNTPSIRIYNEDETPLAMEEVTNETNIISILEIQGIKFTTRNFQIEIELKQVMVLKNSEPDTFFENCLIKTKAQQQQEHETNGVTTPSLVPDLNELKDLSNVSDYDEAVELVTSASVVDVAGVEDVVTKEKEPKEEKQEKEVSETLVEVPWENIEEKDVGEKNVGEKDVDNTVIELKEVEDELVLDGLKEIKDLDFPSLENSLETTPFQLKKPNQVYFELYKAARKRAKEAKKSAILAYLEAKNIKKTYMIETIDEESDSDVDAEIEESESDYE
jgi:hypothetical protein